MALTPAIVINNNASNPAVFSVSDTSTGSDGAIVTFQLLIYDVANNVVLGSPLNFTYTLNATYNVSGLTQDLAINVVANFLSNTGAILYSTSRLFALTGFLEWFKYSLSQNISANQLITGDTNWWDSFFKLQLLVDLAPDAITYGSSIFNAENMLTMGQYLQTNQALFF